MFRTVLIANRGEIACRVIATCRRLGIRAAAVYSEADARAPHVRRADAAFAIGPAPARDSYLDIGAVLEAARRAGAEAIHPGYGFLSENADFAEACIAAGFAFVGAPPDAIRAMGSKSAARAMMADAGLPILEGYHGSAQDGAALSAAAGRIGFPLLIKPSSGGGGRGMRFVAGPDELAAALESARREAASAFADDRLVLERYLAGARHIEVQVFADTHGNTVHLFERDCSVQRRNQKVIEEAPAPGLDPETRGALGAAALEAARAVGYVGAGTVEFLMDGAGGVYFMEMNTRLQVEHPVTEMITGQDLVEWQLRVAAGEALPACQGDLAVKGHAIEARLCAEDPASGFLPSTGTVAHFGMPDSGPRLRIDAGIAAGEAITPHYDSMIAKIVAWGETRAEARVRLADALAGVHVAGPATNRDFLIRVLAREEFAAGGVDTGFVERRVDALTAPPAPPDPVLAFAVIAERSERRTRAEARARGTGDPRSPWAATGGWRLNAPAGETIALRLGGALHAVTVRGDRFGLPGGERAVGGARVNGAAVEAEIDGAAVRATVVRVAAETIVFTAEGTWRFSVHDPLREAEAAAAGAADTPTAPMPGVVVAVAVAPGTDVAAGAPLMVIEAMKVEHTIRAPAAGRIEAVLFGPGEAVEEGAVLVDFTPAGA